ncbi:MAG: hypothetical protein PW999_19860 [Paraburkholderia tropica]|nr:hypothetical protein [Paraburkholderia tropica]
MKNTTLKFMKIGETVLRITSPNAQSMRARVITALLLTGIVPALVQAQVPMSTYQFALPGGAAILFSNASNPQAPLSQRAWRRAVFRFPGGATFILSPQPGKLDSGGVQMEPPSGSNISPSGNYVVIGRIESGTISSGPGEAESPVSREYCSMIEIRTGCVTADQTGEICGAGWQDDRPEQWGSDDQTNLMQKDDRPSANRLLRRYRAGLPMRSLLGSEFGANNLLRCDPPSLTNLEAYQQVSAALRAAGIKDEARLIDEALSKKSSGNGGAAALPTASTQHDKATVSAKKAELYTAPDDAHLSRSYLIQNDEVVVLRLLPVDWAYVDYVNASGKHLRRWIKADQLTITP